MFDMPNVEEVPVPDKLMSYCVDTSARYYKISPLVIHTIADIEGGKVGTAKKNKNGSYDLGVMQLNTVNLSKIKDEFPNVSVMDLIFKPCVNIYVGTWFLSEEIRRAGNNLLKGIGNYHSRTPKYHQRYLDKFLDRYKSNLKDYIKGKP